MSIHRNPGDYLQITCGNSPAFMAFTDDGTLGIGTTTPSANADLTLEGGALCIKETTTPTADTNYGKVYTKNDNKLYFQDGAGSEHDLMAGGTSLWTDQTSYIEPNTIGSNHLAITDTGVLGIGTTNPTTNVELEVYGNAQDSNILLTGNGSSLRLDARTAIGAILTTSNHPLYFGTNNDYDQVAINTSGDVGIGTTNPGGKLEVVGGSTSGDNILKIYSGTDLVAWAKKK